jgi:hypothetical protein
MLEICRTSRSGHCCRQDGCARRKPVFFVLELVAVVTEKAFLFSGQFTAHSCRESEQLSARLFYPIRNQHVSVVVERDQETVEKGIEICREQYSIRRTESFLVGRLPPRPYVGCAQHLGLSAPGSRASPLPAPHDILPKLSLTQSSLDEPLSRCLVDSAIVSEFIDITHRFWKIIFVIYEICLLSGEFKNACMGIFQDVLWSS